MTKYWQQLEGWVWDTSPQDLPRARRWAVLTVRLLYVIFRDITDGQITLRAMGLVYTTLLSLVPLLAITFSMLSSFGIHDVMRPALMSFLAPLGPQADQIVDMVVSFVDNIQVGVLGIAGLALLLYAVISLIQKVESACNYIWQVGRSRSLSRRFSEYLSVLIVGPVLVVAAGSMTASATSNTLVQQVTAIEPFGTTLLLLSQLLPYILWSAGFTFLFLFMPNTRVRFRPALAGGLVSGVLWQTASLAFAAFASAGGKYNAIYAGFAILIFLLIWLYISWVILLLGCRVAFLLQNPEQLQRGDYPPRAGAEREENLAMGVMALVAQAYVDHTAPWRVEELVQALRAVPAHVNNIVDRLLQAGVLVETDTQDCVVPRRDIDTLTIAELLDIVRAGSIGAEQLQQEDPPRGRAAELRRKIDDSRRQALNETTVRDLASAPPPDAGQLQVVAPPE